MYFLCSVHPACITASIIKNISIVRTHAQAHKHNLLRLNDKHRLQWILSNQMKIIFPQHIPFVIRWQFVNPFDSAFNSGCNTNNHNQILHQITFVSLLIPLFSAREKKIATLISISHCFVKWTMKMVCSVPIWFDFGQLTSNTNTLVMKCGYVTRIRRKGLDCFHRICMRLASHRRNEYCNNGKV